MQLKLFHVSNGRFFSLKFTGQETEVRWVINSNPTITQNLIIPIFGWNGCKSKNISSSSLCRDHNKVKDEMVLIRKFTMGKKVKTLRFLFILVTPIQLTK